MRRGLAVAAVGLALATGACGFGSERGNDQAASTASTTSTATPRAGTTPGHPPGQTAPSSSSSTTAPASPYAIDVGDCFGTVDGTGAGGEVDAVQIVPCEQPHLYEAFHEAEVPLPVTEPFPGEDAILAAAAEACTGDAFAEFAGATYDAATQLFVQPLVPTPESWSGGDRTITCAVAPADGLARAGSSEGSGG